jgi:hypothetical protein
MFFNIIDVVLEELISPDSIIRKVYRLLHRDKFHEVQKFLQIKSFASYALCKETSRLILSVIDYTEEVHNSFAGVVKNYLNICLCGALQG